VLDKSIPYKHVFMKASPESVAAVAHGTLPAGYRFKMFEEGDAKHWARIETSVGEFQSEEAALAYFANEFGPYPEKMAQRSVFVVNPDGLPVATTTAWTHLRKVGDRATVHWVSALPSEQGKGLGEAVVREVLTIFSALHPGEEVWLHTQTWSHRAMCLYHKLGFVIAKPDAILAEAFPEYNLQEAFNVLETVMDPARLQMLKDSVC